MKRDYKAKLSDISYSVRQEGAIFAVYMQSDKREILCGQFPERWQAEQAAEQLKRKLDEVQHKPHVHERYKVTLPTIQQIQAVMLGLDPQRAAMFREKLISVNYLLHMLTDNFDSLNDLFGGLIDQSVRQHYKIACKHIDALLDATYQSRVMGATADDYTAVASAAYALEDRFAIFVSYVGKDGWRFEQLEKCLSDLVPQQWLEAERERIGDEIRQCFTSVENRTVAPIKERRVK